MASNWAEGFFSQFTPLLREGRPARTEDGMLVFVRSTDGEYVRFHDNQIQMEELDRYIHNHMLANTQDTVSCSEQQFVLHSSSTVQGQSSSSSILQQDPSPQQQQHLQVQLPHVSDPQMRVDLTNTSATQMHGLSAHTLDSLQLQLQLLNAQHQQQQQQQLQQQQQQQQVSQSSSLSSDMKVHTVDMDAPMETDLGHHDNTKPSESVSMVTLESRPAKVNDHSAMSSLGQLTREGSSNKNQCGAKPTANDTATAGGVDRAGSGLSHLHKAGPAKPGPLNPDMVWMNMKTPEARQRDKKATQALIEIVTRPETQAKLTTKSNKKKAVWQEIGAEMARRGFMMENPGDKCSQKWRNIERTYKDYEMSKKIPDMSVKRPPDCYDVLKRVLKEKHTYDGVFQGEGEEEESKGQRLINEYVDMEASNEAGEQKPSDMIGAEASASTITDDTVANTSAEFMGSPDSLGLSNNSSNMFVNNKTAITVTAGNTTMTGTGNSFNTSNNADILSAGSGSSNTGHGVCVSNMISNTSDDGSSLKKGNTFSETFLEMFPNVSQSQVFPSSLPGQQLPTSTLSSDGHSLSLVLAAVESHKKELTRLEAVLTSVRDLLEEQKQEREAARQESRQRFSELKSLLESNQREKMKFMYDFIKTVQLGKGANSKKIGKLPLGNSSDS